MKRLLFLVIVLCLLTTDVLAVSQMPEELIENLPDQAKELLRDADISSTGGVTASIGNIMADIAARAKDVLLWQTKGAVSVFLIVILCSLLEGFQIKAGEMSDFVLSMIGAMAITMLTIGSMDSLMGLAAETIKQLREFSKILLPVLAAAIAGTGAVTTATFQQMTVVMLVDFLLALIHRMMVPLTYLYIGVLTVSACLPEGVLSGLAEGMKKMITWVLTTALVLFTLYLSIVKVVAGNVDGAALRITKTAISGMIPVVGGVIAEASETILVGAGILKNTVGIFGALSILAICAFPFFQLGIQYLLYKLTACCSMVIGQTRLCKLVQGLGSAFGLLLGMTGSGVSLLLISVFSCIAAVLP